LGPSCRVDWASQPTAKLILSSRDRNCEQYVTGARDVGCFLYSRTVGHQHRYADQRTSARAHWCRWVVRNWFPVWFRHRHLREQNHLLERCRALLMVGVRAIEAGDHVSAKRALLAIRRLEAHWRLGDSIFFKVSIAAWATLWACIVVVILPLGEYVSSTMAGLES
jgi:hypothetical protein